MLDGDRHRAGGKRPWFGPKRIGAFVPALGHWSELVRYLDVTTGKTGVAGPGQTVFLSADGRDLLMSQTATSLTETPEAGGAARLLPVPRGWYLPGGDGLADLVSGAGIGTANGIMVQSEQSPGPAGAVLALWDPASGRVTAIGRARAAIDAYTPPGARYSLLAWLPPGCGPRDGCPVKITNTATRSVLTVPGPGPDGFTMGGAFSPDGTRLAAFLKVSPGQARLAVIDLATGTVRVAAAPGFALGIDIAWARWLPDRAHLIAGAVTGPGYLIDSATLAAQPLRAAAARDRGPDINYTIAVLPPRS